jgi:hypothetical protein
MNQYLACRLHIRLYSSFDWRTFLVINWYATSNPKPWTSVNGCSSVFHNSHNHDRRTLPVMNHDMYLLHWYLEPKTNIFTMGTFLIDYYNMSWKFRMDQVFWVYDHLIVIKSTFNLYASGSLILKSLLLVFSILLCHLSFLDNWVEFLFRGSWFCTWPIDFYSPLKSIEFLSLN